VKAINSRSETGAALLIVTLLVAVLTSIAWLALYSTVIENAISRSFSSKMVAKQTLEGGAQLVIAKIIASGAKGTALQMTGVPAAQAAVGNSADFVNLSVQVHPAIGRCVVLSNDCSGTGGSVLNPDTMCCFRTGSRLSGGKYFKPPVDSGALDPIKIITYIDVPGSQNYGYGIYDFSITAGGPARTSSEARIMIQAGPYKKGCSSGTQYGDNC